LHILRAGGTRRRGTRRRPPPALRMSKCPCTAAWCRMSKCPCTAATYNLSSHEFFVHTSFSSNEHDFRVHMHVLDLSFAKKSGQAHTYALDLSFAKKQRFRQPLQTYARSSGMVQRRSSACLRRSACFVCGDYGGRQMWMMASAPDDGISTRFKWYMLYERGKRAGGDCHTCSASNTALRSVDVPT
jgi:hypothetical protein